MVAAWTYKDVKRDIDEKEWLTKFVKKHYDPKKGLQHLKDQAVIAFEEKFPEEQRRFKGVLETEEEMAARYELQPEV